MLTSSALGRSNDCTSDIEMRLVNIGKMSSSGNENVMITSKAQNAYVYFMRHSAILLIIWGGYSPGVYLKMLFAK